MLKSMVILLEVPMLSSLTITDHKSDSNLKKIPHALMLELTKQHKIEGIAAKWKVTPQNEIKSRNRRGGRKREGK